MVTFGYVAFSIVVAAVIGGITNHLAIKMLFYPREPIVWRGKKLPFTPGLIPKRKEEIAGSLGEVVGEYLVTSDGIKQVLTHPDFQGKLSARLDAWLTDMAERDETVREWAVGYWGEERLADIRFERGQLAADARLCQAERFRCAGK